VLSICDFFEALTAQLVKDLNGTNQVVVIGDAGSHKCTLITPWYWSTARPPMPSSFLKGGWYSTVPISVQSQGKQVRNISADINIQDIDQFLHGLPNIAPVRLKESAQYTLLNSQ